MSFVVLKFGGTSLVGDDQRERVVARVIESKQQGHCPVIVVSAIGRMGEPYATDTLISFAAAGGRELSTRESDLLMSCGEIISGVVLSAAIQKAGYPAVFLTGAQAGIITDQNHNNARILRINPESVVKYARQGKIVVVAGFQGITEEGEVTTLGRGGSDTTAVALGIALGAVRVDIFTDVEGIMTADPRIVSDARLLEAITYNEICQLAREGAKVIHPRAVEMAMQKGIPLRIKCAFGNTSGTLVSSHMKIFEETVDITRNRTITGITHISNIARIKVATGCLTDIPEFQKKIFKALAWGGISVDFINIHPEAIFFTVENPIVAKAICILENMGVSPEVLPDCAKVAAVGAGMTGVPGVMASIVDALAEEKVQILQSADSYTTIWVLVKKEDMKKSIRALHRRFGLNLPN